jgi:UDP-N-acetylmuramyl pentapeptide phosphotransferase/UDP-N-acetylglucosamine-1-phosphate transferase
VDDLRPLPAKWRFAVQAAAATAVVLSRGQGIGAALAPFDGFLPYPLLAACSILWIVWATNLYNFMDGIDGLAGGQAVFASLGLAWAALALGDPALAALLLVFAASAGGFLFYNLPKASIFMGDVGSTAMGFFLASVPFASASKPVPVLAVVLALSLFILDATTTLVRRLSRGEKWYAPHRTHLYQQPLEWGVSHGRITYSFYVGMAIVGGMAAFYPSASVEARVAMFFLATALFAAAWIVVRRLGLRHASMRDQG